MDFQKTSPTLHQRTITMSQYALNAMLLQSGLYMVLGLCTMIIIPLIVSGDSTIQKQGSIQRLSMPPSKVIR